MVEPQASRFWQAALQSGLIDVKGLTSCLEAVPPEKRLPDQIERRLARHAVQSNLLTLWQAQQLLAGRSTGFKIDRYVLLDLLGQGGMGRVYLARDTRLNRRVAVKILSPERVNNPRAIARFHREALVGAQLQHENLVRIYDEGESNGKCYLVMEYIEGKNIGALIAEKGPMAPATAARLVRQVALGLDHAHQKGLIHRDVNPYNILVTHDGTAKLTDLGLAIDLAESGQVTRDGATVGTFDYVSPEQARHSHAVDTRSDIYSLGCTLYHMLAGQVPFPSPSLPEKLFGHQALEPESLTKLVPAIPEGLAQVVKMMMRKPPEDRYPNPVAVAQALEPFIDDAPASFRDDTESTARPGHAQTTVTRITAARPATPDSSAQAPALTEVAPAATPIPPAPEPAAVAERLPAATAPEAVPTFDLSLNAGADPAAESGLDLGLDFGSPLGDGGKKPAAKPARPAAPPAAKLVAPSPLPAPPTPPPAPAVATPPQAEPEPGLDFSFAGVSEPAAEGGLDLGLNFGPPSSPSESSKKPASPPAPVAPSPPPPAASPAPAPAAAKPAPPPKPVAPAKASEPKAPEPVPDFSAAFSNAEKPAEEGLDLGLSFGPEPSRSEPARKPAPAPAAPPKAAPAATTPPAAPSPVAPPEPTSPFLDFPRSGGSDAPSEGVELGLNFGPKPADVEPARKPAPKAAPAAKAPAAPAPAASPAPAPAPEFVLSLGGEAPTEGGLNLGLDFGAPPAPAETPAAAKRSAAAAPAPKPTPVPASAPAPAPAATAAPKVTGKTAKFGMDRRSLGGLAAASLVAVVVGVAVSTGLLGKSEKPAGGNRTAVTKPKPKPRSKATAVASTSPVRASKSDAASSRSTPPVMKVVEPLKEGEGFPVRNPDKSISYEPTLKEAMQRATGSHGHVMFNNREPLKLSGENVANLVGGGPLYMQAEPGYQPVIEVTLTDQPFFTTRTETPLELSGLTIIAHYAGPPDKEAPPLIQGYARVTLKNCSFTATGNVKGSRAIAVEGGGVQAVGCWFEGFDRALDIAAFPNNPNTVSQCMMIRKKLDDQPIGWGLRIRSMAGQNKGRRKVAVENCTVRGKGFVELVDIPPDAQLTFDVKFCAVQAETLMAWVHRPGGDVPLKDALTWKGEENLYDLPRGKPWVVMSAQGTPEMPGGPTDLPSWTAKVGQETGSQAKPIKFQTDPSALSERPLPVDFALPDQGPRSPGADPKKVGLAGRP